MHNNPDRWIIVNVVVDGIIRNRILAGWQGSYLGADYWRLSSDIVAVGKNLSGYEITTETGSYYYLNDGMYGTTSLTSSVLFEMKDVPKRAKDAQVTVTEYTEEEAINLLKGLTSEDYPNYPTTLDEVHDSEDRHIDY